MNLSAFIIAFSIITLLTAFTYFYLFARSQERFIQFWGLAWLAYSVSLFLLIVSGHLDGRPALEYRKLLDMLNISLLLFGVYAFMHMRIPSYWLRFMLYLLIWILTGSYCHFDILSIYLPVFMYQIVATAVICFTIVRFWNIPALEKSLSVMIFMFWGTGKAAVSIYEAYFDSMSSLYLFEIIFSNMLNFCIFVIYLYKIRQSTDFAKKLYRIIAENATDIIFYYELLPQPAFRYITPSVETVTGYAPEYFYGNPSFYLQLAVPEDLSAFAAVFSGSKGEDGQKIFKIQSKSGTLIWIEVNMSVFYESGKAVAVEGIIRDISRMKEDEEALLSSKQARDLLLSYVSHELKTPLTAILGYINGLKDGTFDSEKERNGAFDVIYTKALVLQRSIRDLEQLSKLETKQFAFQMTQTGALELCEHLIGIHAMDIQRAGFALQTQVDAALLAKAELIVDTERMEQVVSNVIFNALKYGGENGIIKVVCSLDAELKNLMIKISDNGPGISAADLPHIFERFYRGRDPSAQRKELGSGLGLTLSKEIIQAFGGDIWAQNGKNGGGLITFTIPIYHESQNH